MQEYVILQIDKSHKASLASFRHLPSIMITEFEDFVWLRCALKNEEFGKQLFKIKFSNWYNLSENYLFKKDKLTPERKFFQADWVSIDEYFPVTLPNFALGGKADVSNPKLELKTHPNFEKPMGMMAKSSDVKTYLNTAPHFRFKNFKYAESKDGNMFLFGTPLLPIIGLSFWQYHNIILPNGKILESKLHMDIFRKQFNTKDVVLIKLDSSYDVILNQNIKALTRQSILES
jgi:hypothetical protein